MNSQVQVGWSLCPHCVFQCLENVPQASRLLFLLGRIGAPLCNNDETLKEWQVDLKVGFAPSGDSNAPYSFSAEIVGLFVVIDDMPKEEVHAFVNANATSVLYSTLREIVHTITSKGPYFPLLLPTPCFHQQK
jgi:hypothetical protein